MLTAADIIVRLRAQCPTLAAVEDPARMEPLEREALPVATVHLVSDEPLFEALSGAGCAYRRRYEVRITAATEQSLRDARAEIHYSLLSAWSQVNDAWSEFFYGQAATHHIRWLAGEMIALETAALQWRDSFQISGCDYPSAP